jgi:hypothetical protein
MGSSRAMATLAVAALAAIPAAAGAAQLQSATVKAPKSGAKYTGQTAHKLDLTLSISGKSVQIVAFQFACGRKTTASTSLQAIPLKRTDDGYRFKISTNGIVSYADQQPDENAAIAVRGLFSRSAKTVSGLLRVKTPRCHDTGYVKWSAKR